MQSAPRTLVAGFGNVLLGDDGFGVEVVRQYTARGVPPSVDAIDVGIGGIQFVLKLMNGYDQVVVVDIVQRGDAPGTVTTFTPCEADTTLRAGDRVDPHVTEPSRALKIARHLNVLPASVTVVGCEPAAWDVGVGLSPEVAAGVERAVETIDSVIADFLALPETRSSTPGHFPAGEEKRKVV